MNCRATNAAGAPCATNFGLSADGYCFPHDPQRAVEYRAMQVARTAKGHERRKLARESLPPGLPRAPKTLEDAVAFASWLTHAAAAGVLDARTAHESAFALNSFRSGVEKRDLERKLTAMNKAVKDMKKCPACAAKWADATGAE